MSADKRTYLKPRQKEQEIERSSAKEDKKQKEKKLEYNQVGRMERNYVFLCVLNVLLIVLMHEHFYI